MERINVTELPQREKTTELHFMSFGFKHGMPEKADYIFDVRCLPNPFYVPEMKELTGLDKGVRDYVMEGGASKELEKNIVSLLETVIPEYFKKDWDKLTIAFGCTGGHHRSVTFAERFHSYFKEKNYCVSVSHRDINK